MLRTKPDTGTAHTQDGWHIDAGDEWRNPRVLDWSGQVVAVLPEESDRASLIAAAPDLLAALKATLGKWVDLVESGDAGFWDAEEEPHVIAARAAIARAEGRQP